MISEYWSNLILRQEICQSDFAREAGWWVEENGRCLARLSDPQYADMFWVSYAITPLSGDPAERAVILSEEFWRDRQLRFRSIEFNKYAENAFPAVIHPLADPGRVTMRALYLIVEPPAWWERLLLALGKRKIKTVDLP